MKDWGAASDKIRQRTAQAVIDSLAVEAPFAFDVVQDQSDVPDFLESNWGDFVGASDAVVDLPGRDLNLTRDALIATAKFFHVVECAREERGRGSLTWTLVDAYHAALLGTRAMAAYYGVLSYTVNRRTLLVDYRPALGRKDDQKKFKRAYPDLSEPIRVLTPVKKLLEQRDAWLLLKRLCNITDDAGAERARIAGLAEMADSALSATRNLVLYDSVHWTWREDFESAKPSAEDLSARFSTRDASVSELIQALTVMYRAVYTYADALCGRIGYDFSDMPHASALEDGELLFS